MKLKLRLISLGFLVGKEVEKKIDAFGNVVVRVGDTRMGISGEIANKINMEYFVYGK